MPREGMADPPTIRILPEMLNPGLVFHLMQPHRHAIRRFRPSKSVFSFR